MPSTSKRSNARFLCIHTVSFSSSHFTIIERLELVTAEVSYIYLYEVGDKQPQIKILIGLETGCE